MLRIREEAATNHIPWYATIHCILVLAQSCIVVLTHHHVPKEAETGHTGHRVFKKRIRYKQKAVRKSEVVTQTGKDVHKLERRFCAIAYRSGLHAGAFVQRRNMVHQEEHELCMLCPPLKGCLHVAPYGAAIACTYMC